MAHARRRRRLRRSTGMDEALGWLCWLEPRSVGSSGCAPRACHGSGSHTGSGIGRTTAWQRWTIALLKIATRLNARLNRTVRTSSH